MNKTDGGPAYPCDVLDGQQYAGLRVVRYQEPGLSKLERFTMAAMQGILSNPVLWEEVRGAAYSRGVTWVVAVKDLAYQQARAMIEAGEETTGDHDSL